jgi:hypothetical protein
MMEILVEAICQNWSQKGLAGEEKEEIGRGSVIHWIAPFLCQLPSFLLPPHSHSSSSPIFLHQSAPFHLPNFGFIQIPISRGREVGQKPVFFGLLLATSLFWLAASHLFMSGLATGLAALLRNC